MSLQHLRFKHALASNSSSRSQSQEFLNLYKLSTTTRDFSKRWLPCLGFNLSRSRVEQFVSFTKAGSSRRHRSRMKLFASCSSYIHVKCACVAEQQAFSKILGFLTFGSAMPLQPKERRTTQATERGKLEIIQLLIYYIQFLSENSDITITMS